ncbi:hypothetical protein CAUPRSCDRAFT_7447, partial [Caulochytrium protostelioides]
LLYPKEDPSTMQLLYQCRNCDHSELAKSPVVYTHMIQQSAMDQTLATLDLSTDPTYPRTRKTCPACSNEEAVFFQSRSKAKDTSMKLFFACTNASCGHRWIVESAPDQNV